MWDVESGSSPPNRIITIEAGAVRWLLQHMLRRILAIEIFLTLNDDNKAKNH
jgi:hypothetical protein